MDYPESLRLKEQHGVEFPGFSFCLMYPGWNVGGAHNTEMPMHLDKKMFPSLALFWQRMRKEIDRKRTGRGQLWPNSMENAIPPPSPPPANRFAKPRFSPLPGGNEALLLLSSEVVQKKQSGDSKVPLPPDGK